MRSTDDNSKQLFSRPAEFQQRLVQEKKNGPWLRLQRLKSLVKRKGFLVADRKPWLFGVPRHFTDFKQG